MLLSLAEEPKHGWDVTAQKTARVGLAIVGHRRGEDNTRLDHYDARVSKNQLFQDPDNG